MRKTITISLMAACLALGAPATGQDQQGPVSQDDQMVKSMQYMLKRAEFVRMLSAQHLLYIDENRDKGEMHLMDDAAQVMAFSLVCQDPEFDPLVLNKIAAETTMQIALKVQGSPIEEPIAQAMGEMTGKDRITLVADVSSNVLMFKIGRRRGLFDALLTDFGTARFCKGMAANMRSRYHGIASYLDDLRSQK